MSASEWPTCRTCPYWDGDDDTPRGDCRRHAPTLLGNGDDFAAGQMARADWLSTHASDWCGDHPDFRSDVAACLVTEPSPAEIGGGR
jgi:hypothetical protein